MKRLLPIFLALLVTFPAAAQRVRAIRTGVAATPDAWLRQRAIPLLTTDPSPIDTDLRPLLAMIGSARIVALGDATHGTHELFTMKQRIVPLLAANAFRTIAFEAPYAEFEVIDEYVRTGRGDVATALASNDYFFWDADEIVALIEWARAQNAAGATPPISIVGADVA
ncbi:MAG TPA: erythromycin esterase family protein, partial [Thermoanaerobaculia bacterium]|nr:erythromycin esterase family protein [Thermoanaerobaculia bacterium]